MPNLKKDKEVDLIAHKSGVTVPLMFNPNAYGTYALKFNAVVADQYFRGDSADEVKAAVHKYLDANVKLEWVPVIEVEESAPFSSNTWTFVGLETSRYYLARTQIDIRMLRWDSTDTTANGDQAELYRLNNSKSFNGWPRDSMAPIRSMLPFTPDPDSEGSQTHYLPYDEATWAALEHVTEAIGRLKLRLRELLSTTGGLKELTDMGEKLTAAFKLLPAPKKSKSEEDSAC